MTTTPTSGAADLLTLIEAYAEARHRQGHSSYNTQTAAALQAVKDALAAGQATAAQQGSVYAELPAPTASIGTDDAWHEAAMRDFADATCALRASHGQAPAGAGMGHTDGGRNMFYDGRFDGESQREQQARLRWANDMRAAFERHTGNGWFDKAWRTETGLWSSAWHACLAAQPSTTAQAAESDSVQEDAARLDFLIEQRAYIVSDPDDRPGYWLHWARPDGSTWVQCDEQPTPRAAIDAARKQGGA